MKNFCKNLVEMNMNSSPTEEISDEITALDAAEFIDAQFDNCKFALDVRMFNKHQQKDDVLQDTIKNELKGTQKPHYIQQKKLKVFICYTKTIK